MKNLNEWVDFDIAMLEVGKALGVFNTDITSVMDVKPVLWSANPVGDSLAAIIRELIKFNYILYDSDEEKFKINDKFKLVEAVTPTESGINALKPPAETPPPG
jgi:hypothetical protein